ncbi:MAG: hypothetical protein KKH12_10880 [Gammaproteobacteria bacterium]|nr:hypothetical protein [Gammaproteobacteria bacterium]
MIKLKRGFKPALQAKHDEEVTPVSKQQPWQAALERFAQLLSQPEWQKTVVNVVLSNRLARFAAITFGAQLKNYAAQEGFARHALAQTYGTVVEQWVLRIHPGRAGTPSLVSALDQVLLDGLQQACEAQQLRLKLVTPYLRPVFNRFQEMLKNDPAWLVINEPGYSLLALLSGGEFISVNGVSHDKLDELPMLLDRENLVSTLTEPCKAVYLHAPSSKTFVAIPKTGYEFSGLDLAVPDGFPASSDGLHAMIMSEFL